MSLPTEIQKLFPPRPQLDPQLKIISRTPLEGGERWIIEYAVAENERVQAYLLIPARATAEHPCAAIIASHQHAGQFDLGKSEAAGLAGNSEMAYGLELFQRGFVVLCPDHAGFEERQQKRCPHQQPLEDRDYEHFLFLNALLHGESLTAKYLFDLQQAVDVLTTFDFVNASRLGVMGHSLGGQTALWLAAGDSRVKIAFSSCGVSQLRHIQDECILHNRAMYLPGLLKVGDMADVVASIAPRAVGMSHGTNDVIFPLEGIREIHHKAESVFKPEHFWSNIFEGAHSFPREIRHQAYNFLEKHLMMHP